MLLNMIIPQSNGSSFNLSLLKGEVLFLLGANGAGKSSLMHKIYAENRDKARRITAHRQTWFKSGTVDLTSENKKQMEKNILSWDVNPQARWYEQYSETRPSIAIYDLIDAQNIRARSIADAVDGANIDLAQTLAKEDAPIKIINELFRLSNLHIEIAIQKGEEIIATKVGCPPYSIAELSDGERNALLIAATVLTVDEGTLILIDEPERHLHRSIISPLLSHLFSKRPDCIFIVSTHDVMLPLDNSSARTLLIRGCSFSGSNVVAWDIDLLLSEVEITDELKKDILGARRKILFIEGTEQSLDKQLYSLIFPNVSVIAKSSCRDVEHAVTGIRDASNIHWLRAFGIIDNDRRTQADIDQLKEKGVYAISVHSVESIYYHPEIQSRVAQRYAEITGEDAPTRLANAKRDAIAAISPHVERLSRQAVEKTIREMITHYLPGRAKIASKAPISISIDVAVKVTEESEHLQDALNANDLSAIIERYPVRETPALDVIASKLGFQNRRQYESAVRKLLTDDKEALEFVVALFGTLASDMDQS